MEIEGSHKLTPQHTVKPAAANQTKESKVAGGRIKELTTKPAKMPPAAIGTADPKAHSAFKRALNKK